MKVKAQLDIIKTVILSVLVVGVLLGAGFYTLTEFRDNFDNELVTVSNETTAAINQTGYTVACASYNGFNSLSISAARNGTSGLVITSGNYTYDSSTGIIRNATSRVWPVVHLTYTCYIGDDAYNGIDNTITATDNVPQLLGLVVLIAMIVVILGIVFTIPGSRTGA
jgi:hypothetical protein